MQQKILRLILLAITTTVLSTCASVNTDDVNTAAQNTLNKQQWPAAPAAPRVIFEKTFSTAQELGINRSFWQWLGDIAFGKDVIRMVRPMDVITHNGQLIYVADPGVHGIHRFDTRNQNYQLIQTKNKQKLLSPIALAKDKKGNIYVTDSQLAQLFIIRQGDDYAEPVALGIALQQPTGLAIEPLSGDIYLVDTRQHQLLVFNSSGQLKKRIGRRGTQPGEFNYPTLIQEHNGTLLVNDSLNYRIQSFDLKGNYLGSFGEIGQSSGYLSRPKGIGVDKFGHIYIVDALLNNIQLFNNRGQLLMTFGERGQQPGQFWLPGGIHIDAQQKIYIADAHNQRIQVFRYIGAEL
ncbi:MAG TPA: 6-bladed beta-propeller [Gammaproteobacteria bacterium]|nr:6-bladed beta-propeller [Gammaproteobacteria bacterium]